VTADAKICGISDKAALSAAVDGGARYVGFVFFPRSPRNVTPNNVAALTPGVPDGVTSVALSVDPDDALVDAINAVPGIDMFQLHGGETPERVADIRRRTGKRVMKAVKVSAPENLSAAEPYLEVADMLLFDAKTPKEMANALPGGNAISFDWTILSGREWLLPWMLSGGLDADNVGEAIDISGAPAVDVSSGVETSPGAKDPSLIAEFLASVRAAG